MRRLRTGTNGSIELLVKLLMPAALIAGACGPASMSASDTTGPATSVDDSSTGTYGAASGSGQPGPDPTDPGGVERPTRTEPPTRDEPPSRDEPSRGGGSVTSDDPRPSDPDPGEGNHTIEVPAEVVVETVVNATPGQVRGGDPVLTVGPRDVCRIKPGARYLIDTLAAGTCTLVTSQPAGRGLKAGPTREYKVVVVKDQGRFGLSRPADRQELRPGNDDAVPPSVRFDVTATVESGGDLDPPVTIGTCAVVGQQGRRWTFEATKVGPCTITFSQKATATHDPDQPERVMVEVVEAWGEFLIKPDRNDLEVGDEITVAIAITRGGAVTVTATGSAPACTVAPATPQRSKVTVLAVAAGSCTLRATQQAGGGYGPGPDATLALAVTKRPASFRWVVPHEVVIESEFVVEVTAVSGGPVRVDVDGACTGGPQLVPETGGPANLRASGATGICTVTATQAATSSHTASSRTDTVTIVGATIDTPAPTEPPDSSDGEGGVEG